MKRLKRILGFFMAIVIMMSTFSVVAQGRASYVDGYLTNYDDVDQPVITFNQACTMVLDSVDVLLADKNMIIDLSILGELRLNSVNNAFTDLYKFLGNILLGLAGDLNDLDRSALKDPRRNNGVQDTSDTDVIYALVAFLGNSDNRTVIGKLIDGTINLGLASSAFDPEDLNINQIVKGMLYGMAYPDATVPDPVNENADTMVQKVITDLVQGELDPITGEYDGFAPELVTPVNYIDIVGTTSSAYDFVGTLLQQAWNIIVVPLLNTDLKKTVREACGVVYDPLLEDDPLYTGDESNLNEYADILNIDYVVPTYTVPSGSTFIAELNNLLASVINALTKNYTWPAGLNTNLLTNFASAAKYILSETGDVLFPNYLDVASPAEVDAMNDQELFSYILRSLLNSSSDSIYIPNDADSLVEVAWYAAKDALADKLPAIDYSSQPKTQTGMLTMVADLLAYSINQSIDMNPAVGTVPGTGLVAYGQGFDATLLMVTNWAVTNYGGVLNATFSQTDPWAAIDTLLNLFIPTSAKWLPASVNGNSHELLINRLVGGLLNLDVNGILSLFERVDGSELGTKTLKKILIDTVARVVNSIFPAAIGNFTSFETLISNANLATIIKNILNQLNIRRTSIMPAIMPLLASVLERSTPQEYQDPDIQLPEVVSGSVSFSIRNDSTGINTGATDKNNSFVQDNLYKIKIVSVASSIPAITVSNLAGTVINGGDAVTCTLGGTFTANQQLMITLTYNVLTEDGTVLTPTPLSQRAFSYISQTADDGDTWTTLQPESNNYHVINYNSTYLNGPAEPEAPEELPPGASEAEIAAYDIAYEQWQTDTAQYSAKKNATMQSLKSSLARLSRKEKSGALHGRDATVSRKTCAVHGTLVSNGITLAPFSNISTTDSKAWNIPYFSVNASATRPADGLYNSSYSYYATETQLWYTKVTFNFTHSVVLYTDYDLPSLLERAIEANRNPNDYSSSTAFNNYIDAIKDAVAIVYRPRVASSFMTTHAAHFETAATNLKVAIEALEATVVSAGVGSLITAMDQIAPPNDYDDPENPGMKLNYEYDDPNYNYMGKEDYVGYTYGRYRDERDNASGIYWSQQLPQEPVRRISPPLTPEEEEAFDVAHAQWVIDYAAAVEAINPISAVSVAYALNRLNLYAQRLVHAPAVKARLNEAVALVAADMPLEHGCSADMWDRFERAYDFATLVNADSSTTLRQTKVNEARDRLLEAWKKTTQIFVDVPPETGFDIDNVNFYISGLDTNTSPLDVLVQATPGATLVFNNTPNGQGTGTVVDLMSGEELIRSYTIIINGDLTGDRQAKAFDALLALQNSAEMITLDSNQTLAGDINNSGTITAFDSLRILQYSAGLITSF